MPPAPHHSPSLAEQRALNRTPKEAFWHGFWQSSPFLIVILPFGLLFGITAMDAGMSLAQVLGFSTLVLAGASQFTAVQLLADHAPLWVVILSALAVNLRMAMYSASLVPWLGDAAPRRRALLAYLMIDQTYATSIQHYERFPRLSLQQRLAYFGGTALATCLPWPIISMVGATIGRAIPPSLGLDFAIPITFLAMIAPLLRSVPHMVAAFTAVVLSLLFSPLPNGLGVLAAAPLAMMAGAETERRLTLKRGL